MKQYIYRIINGQHKLMPLPEPKEPEYKYTHSEANAAYKNWLQSGILMSPELQKLYKEGDVIPESAFEVKEQWVIKPEDCYSNGDHKGIKTAVFVAYPIQHSEKEDLEPSKEQCLDVASVASHSCTDGTTLSYEELQKECNRLAGIAEYWQNKYYELNPPFQRPKLDNL